MPFSGEKWGRVKTTLMKIISGVTAPTTGSISLHNTQISLKNPMHALNNGLVCVFQELSLVPDLSVKEKSTFGGQKQNAFGFVSTQNINPAVQVLQQIDAGHIALDTKVKDLTLAEQQQVGNRQSPLAKNPKLLILDESTSAPKCIHCTKNYLPLSKP